MRYCPIYWQYSQLVVRWYTVTTYDLYIYLVYYTNKYYVQEEWHDNEVRPSVLYTMLQKYNVVYTYAIFSGFYCSMETSRIIRVWACNYIIRIAAVSQEHILVCITRKVTRPENDMVLVLASKLTWLLCGWSKWTYFRCGGSELA